MYKIRVRVHKHKYKFTVLEPCCVESECPRAFTEGLFVFKKDQDGRRVGSKRQLLSVTCRLRLVVLTAACWLAAISLVF
jgi:hypothetical protein